MANAKNARDPSTTSAAYDRMRGRWQLIDTVLGGTESMRAAGKTLLPQHKAETDDNYAIRLSVTVLNNKLEQTLNNLAAKPFSEPVVPNDDVPTAIVDQVLDDVDKQGNKLDVFCRQWFRAGLAKGVAAILVDSPRIMPKADGRPRTLEDDRREKVRPYWQMIKPENIIFAYGEMVDGVERLSHVRIAEVVKGLVDFQEVWIEQIRVLEPGLVTLYRKDRLRSGRSEWLVHERWTTGLSYIPLVPFYTSRDDVFECKPPLLDLAYLNVTHWQSSSDQRHVMTVARFPMLACSGGSDEGGTVKVGPNELLFNSDAQGKFYYVEHTGAAIEAGRNDLKDLEAAMDAYGSEFLKDKPGDVTATQRALDGAESVSTLQAYALGFQDAVAQALDITADWMKLGVSGGTVKMQVDISPDEAEGDIKPAMELRKARDISRQAIVQRAIALGHLPPDFDIDKDAALLEGEMAAAAAAMEDLDPAGGNGGGGSDGGDGGAD